MEARRRGTSLARLQDAWNGRSSKWVTRNSNSSSGNNNNNNELVGLVTWLYACLAVASLFQPAGQSALAALVGAANKWPVAQSSRAGSPDSARSRESAL